MHFTTDLAMRKLSPCNYSDMIKQIKIEMFRKQHSNKNIKEMFKDKK